MNLDPPIGEVIDFFNHIITRSIEIALTFVLSTAEISSLLSDIVAEAPQMKNAVDSLSQPLWLRVTYSVISNAGQKCGYVGKLELVKPSIDFTKPFIVERILLSMDQKTALELRDALAKAQRRSADASAIVNFMSRYDEDDWRRMRSDSTPSPVRRPSPRLSGKELQYRFYDISTLARQSTTYQEFIAELQSLADAARAEARAAIDAPLNNSMSTFAGEDVAIPEYAKHLIEALARLKVLYLRERREPIGQDEATRLLSLKIKRGGEEVFDNIQSVVSALLGVKINVYQGERAPSASGDKLLAEMDVDKFLVEVNGSGVREALRLVLDVEFQTPDILLAEEPETYLHPGLETSMTRYLKRLSSRTQVFISTHSTNFLDTGEMDSIYLISNDKSTQAQSLDLDSMISELPRELGLRLSSLFMYERLVFVEGPSDEAILREWATTLTINLSKANVGFVHLRGSRNFRHFAAKETLELLARRHVDMWFLLDKDERDEKEIAAFKELLGPYARILVLKKREIENYLLCPRAVSLFIKWKIELSGGDMNASPGEADILKAFEDCSNLLKAMTVEKHAIRSLMKMVGPVSVEANTGVSDSVGVESLKKQFTSYATRYAEVAATVENACKAEMESLENKWSSDKLSLVPGDLLLDLTCKHFGVRYKKERDGSRLASRMNTTEIDEQFREFLTEIGELTEI